MVVIDIKGSIVDDGYGMMYDYFGFGDLLTWPSKIKNILSETDDEEVILNIASNGGDVFSASEIYTKLKSSGKNIIVNVEGLAASAASVIAMSGNTVNISPTAQIMIHKAWTQSGGNSDDLRQEAQVLDGIDQSIINAYELKTGMDRTNLLQLMSNETWLTAQEAVDKGFADSIMFVNNNKLVFSNAISNLPSSDKLNEFLNFMNFKKRNSGPNNTTKENKQADLRSRKLAILLQK